MGTYDFLALVRIRKDMRISCKNATTKLAWPGIDVSYIQAESKDISYTISYTPAHITSKIVSLRYTQLFVSLSYSNYIMILIM